MSSVQFASLGPERSPIKDIKVNGVSDCLFLSQSLKTARFLSLKATDERLRLSKKGIYVDSMKIFLTLKHFFVSQSHQLYEQ